jgi:hypothetical protein
MGFPGKTIVRQVLVGGAAHDATQPLMPAIIVESGMPNHAVRQQFDLVWRG